MKKYTKREITKHRKMWTDALRGKRFRQGTRFLRQVKGGEESFCCLGVACELARENGVRIKVQRIGAGLNAYFAYGSGFGQSSSELPVSVMRWLGLRTRNGDLGSHRWGALTHANDSGKMSFRKIANLIDKHPEGLFVE